MGLNVRMGLIGEDCVRLWFWLVIWIEVGIGFGLPNSLEVKSDKGRGNIFY